MAQGFKRATELECQRRRHRSISRIDVALAARFAVLQKDFENAAAIAARECHGVMQAGAFELERLARASLRQAKANADHRDALRFEDAALSGKLVAIIFGATLNFFLA